MTFEEFLKAGPEELISSDFEGSKRLLDEPTAILSHIDEMEAYHLEYILASYAWRGGPLPLELARVFVESAHKCTRLLTVQVLRQYPELPADLHDKLRQRYETTSDSIERGITRETLDWFEATSPAGGDA